VPWRSVGFGQRGLDRLWPEVAGVYGVVEHFPPGDRSLGKVRALVSNYVTSPMVRLTEAMLRLVLGLRVAISRRICHPVQVGRRDEATTKGIASMGFCEHCEGQRFDRAQVLRQLRQTRARLRGEAESCTVDEALQLAIQSVRALEVPHLEPVDDWMEGTTEDQVVH